MRLAYYIGFVANSFKLYLACRAREIPLSSMSREEQHSVFYTMKGESELRLKVDLPVICVKKIPGVDNGCMGRVVAYHKSTLKNDLVSALFFLALRTSCTCLEKI
jgi:hypothetical protein